MPNPPYLLDNAWRRGRARLDAVEAFLDPGTFALLNRIGVADGWHCLELGAGGGSVSDWLAQRSGASGRVVATDIDTRHLAGRANPPTMQIRRHDIVEEALEERAFDLIHARLVLEHLPDRDRVIPKLVRALRPGGWLLVESVDYVSAVPVSALGAREHERSQSIRLRQFADAGIRFDLGRHLPGMLRRNGLLEVGNEGRVFVMEGGSPGAAWFRLSLEQLRPRLVGAGKLSDAEVGRMLELFADPGWAALSPVIFAAWGRAA